MIKVLDKKNLENFKKKNQKAFDKSTVVAYAMFLDMELEKVLGSKYKEKISILKDRFDNIAAKELSDLVENVRIFGRDLAFDTYELILAARNDKDWRGQQYTVNLPSNEKLLQEYELEKRRLSNLKEIRNSALRSIELKKLYPAFNVKQIYDLAHSDLPLARQTLVVLSFIYTASALYIRNKLTEARKKK